MISHELGDCVSEVMLDKKNTRGVTKDCLPGSQHFDGRFISGTVLLHSLGVLYRYCKKMMDEKAGTINY